MSGRRARLTLSPSKSKWVRKSMASFMGTSSFLYKIWKIRLCTALSWTQAECRLLLSANRKEISRRPWTLEQSWKYSPIRCLSGLREYCDSNLNYSFQSLRSQMNEHLPWEWFCSLEQTVSQENHVQCLIRHVTLAKSFLLWAAFLSGSWYLQNSSPDHMSIPWVLSPQSRKQRVWWIN